MEIKHGDLIITENNSKLIWININEDEITFYDLEYNELAFYSNI